MRDPDGTSKGCAFIRFKNKEDALIAMRFLNGNVYLAGSDKPIEVRFAEKKAKTQGGSEAAGKHGSYGGASNQATANPMNPMGAMPSINPMTVNFFLFLFYFFLFLYLFFLDSSFL